MERGALTSAFSLPGRSGRCRSRFIVTSWLFVERQSSPAQWAPDNHTHWARCDALTQGAERIEFSGLQRIRNHSVRPGWRGRVVRFCGRAAGSGRPIRPGRGRHRGGGTRNRVGTHHPAQQSPLQDQSAASSPPQGWEGLSRSPVSGGRPSGRVWVPELHRRRWGIER